MVNFLELERLALPSLSLVISYLAGVLLIVGLATPGWVKVSIDIDIYNGFIQFCCSWMYSEEKYQVVILLLD